MKKVKISNDFKYAKTDSELLVFATNVLTSLTGKAQFLSIKSLVETDLKKAVDEYSVSLQAALDRAKSQVADKRQKRDALINILSVVATHCDLIANGDETLIRSIGFKPRGSNERRVLELGKAEIKTIRRGDNPQEVEVEVLPMEGGEMIALEWSADGGKTWHNGTYSTKLRFKATTTVPRTDTKFQARWLGRNERQGAWSDPVEVFVV